MYEIHPNDCPIVMFVIRLWMTYQTLKYILQNEAELEISSTPANFLFIMISKYQFLNLTFSIFNETIEMESNLCTVMHYALKII